MEAFLGDAAEGLGGAAEAVARHPQGGDVGDGASRAEGTESMLAVVDPLGVKGIVTAVDQAVQHGEDLALQGSEGLGGLDLDQVLVERRHDARQRQHEVRQRRGHMADEAGCRGMHRLGDQLLLDELGVGGDVGRLLGDLRRGEVGFDLFEAALEGDDMGLQKTGDILADRPVDGAQCRIRSFRNGEDTVEVFQGGTRHIAVFRHAIA